MLPFGSQRSLPVQGSCFFGAHFSAAAGKFNNTKSVGSTRSCARGLPFPEENRSNKAFGFLRRCAGEGPRKPSNFLSTLYAGFCLVCSKIDPGQLSQGSLFAQRKLAQLGLFLAVVVPQRRCGVLLSVTVLGVTKPSRRR